MAPLLPVDIQILILVLALPPIAPSTLAQRRRKCRVFSLIHRDWTQTAQRELASERRERIDGVELNMGDAGGPYTSALAPFAKEVVQAAGEVVVRWEATDLRLPGDAFLSLTRLHYLPLERTTFPLVAYQDYARRLTHLSLSDIDILDLLPLSPAVTTLILTRVILSRHHNTREYLARFPALQNLAWVQTGPVTPSTFFPDNPDLRLRRLYFFLTRRKQTATLDGMVAVLPSSVEQLTLFGGNVGLDTGLQHRCAQKGVQLQYSTRSLELVTDVELWARSQQ
ncbi:hypothetical protein JCM11641_004236 [Rhodosporidiobolus odoratus]